MREYVQPFIAFPVYREVPSWTVISLLETTKEMHKKHVQYTVWCAAGNSQVVGVRNQLVAEFLKTQATHMFWLDADMVWTPEEFFQLLFAGKDCINGPYLRKAPGGELLDQGLGFCCVKREVMEKLSAAAPLGKVYDGTFPQIFKYAPHEGVRGEDIEFYKSVRALGYHTYVDRSLHLGHVGPHIYQHVEAGEVPLEDDHAQAKHPDLGE